MLIQGLIHKAKDTILNFQVVNLGSPSYHHRSLASAFAHFERSKNRKHKRLYSYATPTRLCPLHCFLFRQPQPPCQTSSPTWSRPTPCIKWSQPYSSVSHYVKSRNNLFLVRSTSHCLHGSCIPATLISAACYTDDHTEGLYPLAALVLQPSDK